MAYKVDSLPDLPCSEFGGIIHSRFPHLYSVPGDPAPAAKIDDYGLIGDCRSAALVSKFGSIDWLCWPRFDSPSIFAAILDQDRGGHWGIRPTSDFQVSRSYVGTSNVLETRFACSNGEVRLTDLMPVSSEYHKRQALVPDHEILRAIVCTRGSVTCEMDFCPRPNFGANRAWLRKVNRLGVRVDVDRGAYWLRATVPLIVTEDSASAQFPLKEGDSAYFSLTYTEQSPAVLPALGKPARASIERSISWWQEWAGRIRYDGLHRECLMRSALALKLLTYAPSGAVVAAPTTSLPERIGGSFNWDYRFCWLRDASLTIRAMLGLGFHDEAESFLTWLLTATALTQPQLRVLYTVFGRRAPVERELDHLSGYMHSHPVRIGNGARDQLQLDIYGEVVDATAQYAQHVRRLDRVIQKALIGLGNYVARNWDLPDEGIWEPRSGRSNNTHSRLMCWTALDRLLAMSEKGQLQNVPTDLFTRERNHIRQQIETRAWNDRLQSYVSVLDSDEIDATVLRLPWYGFERADSERMKRTYRFVRQELGGGNGLLYRHKRQLREGAFGVCGFWAVEYLALAGVLDQAREIFQQLLQYQNDLGLFAEETDPRTGAALGNFPQAFTHVGLISAALTIAEHESGNAHPAVKVGSDVGRSRAEAKA